MSDSTDPLTPKYKRVLLKLSGESLGHGGKSGISIDETAQHRSSRLKRILAPRRANSPSSIGGGNILRGAQFSAGGETLSSEATAHYMGMLATIINGLALQDALESDQRARRGLQTAIRMESVAEPYIRRRAIRHLEKGRVVILAGGTGNPFVTTDTAAALLRARELEVEQSSSRRRSVDGVYSDDPEIERRTPRSYDKPELTGRCMQAIICG